MLYRMHYTENGEEKVSHWTDMKEGVSIETNLAYADETGFTSIKIEFANGSTLTREEYETQFGKA